MKKIAFIAVSFCMMQILHAQIRAIPAEVTEAFKTKFPNAKMVTWKDNIANFEADCTVDNVSYEIKFNTKGDWLETAKKLEFKELNEEIKDGFQKSKYKDWDVRVVKEITAKEKEVIFRVLVRKNDVQKKYLFFNHKGQLIKDLITL